MICPNCAESFVRAPGATTCPHCGAELLPARVRAGERFPGLEVIGGIVLGLGFTVALWSAGVFFANVGPNSNEFSSSRGAAWFYFAVLLLTFVALIVLFLRPVRARLDNRLRGLLLAMLFVVLGGMWLCNMFSANSLKG